MALRFCPNCGVQRLPEARYCGACGYDFGELEAASSPSSAASSPGAPVPSRRPLGGGQAPHAAAPAGARPALLGALLVLILLATGGGTFLVLRGGSPRASGLSAPVTGGAAFAPASLDPAAPAFPVPAGATLINAQVEGSGAAAYRLEAWNSPLAFDATVAFYAGLHDPRWSLQGSLAQTPQAAQGALADGQGVFAQAELVVDRTSPVQIAVQFVPPGLAAAPPASQAPGPTIAFGPLPAATALPAGFPSRLVPQGGTLVDAASLGGTFYAIFVSPSDVATLAQASQSALQGYAQSVTSTSQGGAITIAFTTGGHPGMVVLSPASAGGAEVDVEVTP